jgi:hypothetical protein
MPDETKAFPEQTQRDPSKPHNQLHPISQRSSGTEVDEICGAGISQSEAGLGLDKAIRTIDRKGKP